MRVIARRLGASYTLCEVMLDYFIVQVKDRPRNSHLMHVADEEHPVGGQLMGAEPEQFGPAALRAGRARLRRHRHQLRLPGEEGARPLPRRLSSEPARTSRSRSSSRVRDAVPPHIPVTRQDAARHRRHAESRDKFFEIFDGAYARGVAAITVHGRTVMQRYDGPVAVGVSARSERARRRPHRPRQRRLVHGAGLPRHDRRTPASTASPSPAGASAIRGSFSSARALAAGLPLPAPPTLFEQRDVIAEHYRLAEELYGAERCVPTMRKFGIKYSQLHPQACGGAGRFRHGEASRRVARRARKVVQRGRRRRASGD